MAHREVGMLEVKEVLRLWLGGVARKRVARQLGLDPKTVRRYVEVAEANGLRPRFDAGASRRGLDDMDTSESHGIFSQFGVQGNRGATHVELA